jgi:hypothetical protein
LLLANGITGLLIGGKLNMYIDSRAAQKILGWSLGYYLATYGKCRRWNGKVERRKTVSVTIFL